jgi:hypothetical protein
MTEDGRSVLQHTKGTFIASRQSIAEGFNLQHFSEALVTAVVANGRQAEQLYGRLHRPGQEEDVTFDLMLGCAEHLQNFWKSKADAQYIWDTFGDEQKLCYADIDVPQDINENAPQWRSKGV